MNSEYGEPEEIRIFDRRAIPVSGTVTVIDTGNVTLGTYTVQEYNALTNLITPNP